MGCESTQEKPGLRDSPRGWDQCGQLGQGPEPLAHDRAWVSWIPPASPSSSLPNTALSPSAPLARVSPDRDTPCAADTLCGRSAPTTCLGEVFSERFHATLAIE